MKVFISWSGETSRLVAQALREWLPQIIQAIKPWMSEEDINKGARWRSELTTELDKTSFGIFCLTKENLTAPWLLFEAGAVSKKVEASFVCTYLIDLTPGDVAEPLSQFQATVANKADTRKLLLTINKALKENALEEGQLNKAFEKWWPDLDEKLKSKPIPKTESKRDPRELLEEILSTVRELNRISTSWGYPIGIQPGFLTPSLSGRVVGTLVSTPSGSVFTPSGAEMVSTPGGSSGRVITVAGVEVEDKNKIQQEESKK